VTGGKVVGGKVVGGSVIGGNVVDGNVIGPVVGGSVVDGNVISNVVGSVNGADVGSNADEDTATREATDDRCPPTVVVLTALVSRCVVASTPMVNTNVDNTRQHRSAAPQCARGVCPTPIVENGTSRTNAAPWPYRRVLR